MMMSRPRPETEQDAAPAKSETKKQSSVEDLERRLAMLGGATTTAAPGVVATDDEEDAAATSTTAPEGASTVKGGKNALLARIMAAQERAKQAGQSSAPPAQEPAPVIDLLSDTPGEVKDAPPPAFDAVELPPPAHAPAAAADEPPPAFDLVQDSVMEQLQAPSMPSPVMTPSAPAFEDLLDSSAPPFQENPMDGISMVQPPKEAQEDDEELWGGLPEEERKALMDEQRKIMEAIEQEKAANAAAIAAAQAENFDQRGGAPATAEPVTGQEEAARRMVHLGGDQTVALHGQERTRAAIAAGTAVLVQCINCMNWMQVTDNATLMYCPVCSVVSPVLKQDAVFTREEAVQLSNDQKLAEQLQNEEYKTAGRTQEGEEAEEEEESWWDSITTMFGVKKGTTPTHAVPVSAEQQARLNRGEMGVSRPPGAMQPANIDGGENDLLLQSNRPQAARVAERQPLFSCVVDSVSSAASTVMGTTQNLHEDREGNIHGVDASSLLTVTRASRDQDYHALPDEEH